MRCSGCGRRASCSYYSWSPAKVHGATRGESSGQAISRFSVRISRSKSTSRSKATYLRLPFNGSHFEVLLRFCTHWSSPRLTFSHLSRCTDRGEVRHAARHLHKHSSGRHHHVLANWLERYVALLPHSGSCADGLCVSGIIHNVVLTQLKPATRYYYVCGGGSTFSPQFSFMTLPTADSPG